MRYSLHSRFQGALLGLAIGETLGAAGGTPHSPRPHWHPSKQTEFSDTPCSFSWTQQTLWQAEKLLQTYQPQAAPPAQLPAIGADRNGNQSNADAIGTAAGHALVTLPFALFSMTMK